MGGWHAWPWEELLEGSTTAAPILQLWPCCSVPCHVLLCLSKQYKTVGWCLSCPAVGPCTNPNCCQPDLQWRLSCLTHLGCGVCLGLSLSNPSRKL